MSSGPTEVSISGPVPIGGSVATGFEPVLAEFIRNFTERGELGGAVAAYRGAECLVDLHGGWIDSAKRQNWSQDTMVLVFSTTKGMAATAMAVAASRGLLSFSDLVAEHWPEFAAGGKQNVTVGMLLAHQAGVPVIDQPLTPRLLTDHDRLAVLIASQTPQWRPGTRHGYHALDLGFYESELIRRTDPGGRTLGRFFQDEVAAPLGVQFHIGLPPHVPTRRIAPIVGFHPAQMALHMRTMPPGLVLGYMRPWSLTYRSMSNPKVRRPSDFDRPEWRRVEFPSLGGIGAVRAIARIYADSASGGARLGLSPDVLRAIERPHPLPSGGPKDAVLRVNTAYSGGFIKPPSFNFGTDSRAYGTMGAGGSFGFADPATGVGFAYAGNRMGFHLWDDPRERALRDALFQRLGVAG